MSFLVSMIAAIIIQLHPKVPAKDAEVFADAIVQAQEKHGIQWQLMTALLYKESHFQPWNKSKTNDWGIGQHHCPSFYCKKTPTKEQKKCLLDARCNIDLTAQELLYHQARCKRRKPVCADWVQLYNEGAKNYARRLHDLEDRINKLAERHAAESTGGDT